MKFISSETGTRIKEDKRKQMNSIYMAYSLIIANVECRIEN